MTRGRKALLMVALVAGTGCLAGYLLWEREPSYRGRGLSAWLRDFESEQQETRARAAEAIKQIGPRAVPFVVERLSLPTAARRKESPLEQWKARAFEWLGKHTVIQAHPVRRPNPRRQALAALDALGAVGKDALPALEKLLHEEPPDPAALYIVARIGPAGEPLLRRMLTNDVKVLRLEARVCMDMITSHSEALYGEIGLGPNANAFERRICEFNIRVLRAAFEEYSVEYPKEPFRNGVFEPQATYPWGVKRP